jgi:hypothetical protein
VYGDSGRDSTRRADRRGAPHGVHRSESAGFVGCPGTELNRRHGDFQGELRDRQGLNFVSFIRAAKVLRSTCVAASCLHPRIPPRKVAGCPQGRCVTHVGREGWPPTAGGHDDLAPTELPSDYLPSMPTVHLPNGRRSFTPSPPPYRIARHGSAPRGSRFPCSVAKRLRSGGRQRQPGSFARC